MPQGMCIWKLMYKDKVSSVLQEKNRMNGCNYNDEKLE